MKPGNGAFIVATTLIVTFHWNLGLLASAQGQEAEKAKTGTTIKPLTKEQQEQLLGERLDGRTEGNFGQFANRFLVMSRLSLRYGVGLMTSSRETASAALTPVFPPSYKPTLRELLDVIALQTRSQWKYDPTSKYIQSDVDTGPVQDLAIFEFTKTARDKPYRVTLPKGWRSEDKGHWTMYVPPDFPLGMDIYELGTYSSDAKTEAALLKTVRRDVALEWAKLAKDGVAPEDFTPAKVGPYEALYFETMMPLRDGSSVRWRQWVFMVGNTCYGVVSTIFPPQERRIFPEVQSMVASFTIKQPK